MKRPSSEDTHVDLGMLLPYSRRRAIKRRSPQAISKPLGRKRLRSFGKGGGFFKPLPGRLMERSTRRARPQHCQAMTISFSTDVVGLPLTLPTRFKDNLIALKLTSAGETFSGGSGDIELPPMKIVLVIDEVDVAKEPTTRSQGSRFASTIERRSFCGISHAVL